MEYSHIADATSVEASKVCEKLHEKAKIPQSRFMPYCLMSLQDAAKQLMENFQALIAWKEQLEMSDLKRAMDQSFHLIEEYKFLTRFNKTVKWQRVFVLWFRK